MSIPTGTVRDKHSGALIFPPDPTKSVIKKLVVGQEELNTRIDNLELLLMEVLNAIKST